MTAPDATAPGVYPGLTYAEYCAIPAVRVSQLSGYQKSAMHAHHGVDRPSDEKALGAALHCAVLEPEVYERTYALGRKAKGPGSRAIEARRKARAAAAGVTELTAGELLQVDGMRAALLEHPTAGPLITGAVARELTAVWQDPDTGALCKARWDLLTSHEGRSVIADLKTCKDASLRWFSKDVTNYGYHRAAAFYLAGAAALSPEVDRGWVWIVCEQEPAGPGAPHGVAIYEPEEELLRAGADEWRAYLATHLACREAGVWPGYPVEVQRIAAPRWMGRRA